MILLAAMLAAAPVAANPCGDRGTQTEMNQCFAARAVRADAALNVAWRRLMTKVGRGDAAYLKAQRLWIQFRDAECAAEPVSSADGSMHGMEVSACIATLTEERARTIDRLASQDR